MAFPRIKKDQYESCGFKQTFYDLNKDLFHAIYFVDYISGSLLLSTKFSKNSRINKNNEDLISSFLNAINLFINELSENEEIREEIQEINFKDSRILYERKNRLMIIGISKKTNLPIEREILKMILEDFYARFEQKITNFKGFIDKEILNYRNVLNNLDFNGFIEFKE